MSIKVTPDNYPEIIEVYNSEGKTAAYDLIRSHFGIKNPTCVMKRMKQASELFYNAQSDRFETHKIKEEESVFLNLDELCGRKESPQAVIRNERVPVMEDLIQSLIKDRLLEISKYVTMDPIGKNMIVDRTSMQSDGYKVSIS